MERRKSVRKKKLLYAKHMSSGFFYFFTLKLVLHFTTTFLKLKDIYILNFHINYNNIWYYNLNLNIKNN